MHKNKKKIDKEIKKQLRKLKNRQEKQKLDEEIKNQIKKLKIR